MANPLGNIPLNISNGAPREIGRPKGSGAPLRGGNRPIIRRHHGGGNI
jgi:hypothetical protein